MSKMNIIAHTILPIVIDGILIDENLIFGMRIAEIMFGFCVMIVAIRNIPPSNQTFVI